MGAAACAGPSVTGSSKREKAAPVMTLFLAQADNGRDVSASVGASISIKLSENATTGYRWAIEHYDATVLEALESQPQYAQGAVGSGGQVTFLFQAKQPGSSEIALKHWRQWAGDSSIIDRFRVHVTVVR
jgi:inhibitor of cysteine peptidase